jgi:MFS family permease
MEQAKIKGFGFRGWMLIIWVATAFLSYVVIGNYPLNIFTSNEEVLVYGDASTLSTIYTIASIVGIAIQLILSQFAGKIKSWKKLGVILGLVSIITLLGLMFLQPGTPWLVIYGIGTVISAMYGTWCLSVLIGVWFPTRKGMVMGIVTFAFPIANGVIGVFAGNYFGGLFARLGTQMDAAVGNLIQQGVDPEAAAGIAMGQFAQQSACSAFLPFLIILVIGLLIGIFLITDFPEQCGAFRDNNRNMTPEMAQAMMKAEEENRRTTVWKTGHTLACPDFWLITIPMGLLLMFAVGMMTQTQAIIGAFGNAYDFCGGYTGVMIIVAIFGIVGSFIFGIIDQKLGTKKAVIIAMICMVISGLLGATRSAMPLFVGIIILAMFMGASSNFTVSSAVQYWRLEDFPSVFSAINPVANLINAVGPMLVATLFYSALGSFMGAAEASGTITDETAALAAQAGSGTVFMFCAIFGAIGLVLALLFRPSRVKKYDDKYRTAAGKPLDDVLVGRK